MVGMEMRQDQGVQVPTRIALNLLSNGWTAAVDDILVGVADPAAVDGNPDTATMEEPMPHWILNAAVTQDNHSTLH